jgi:hypothetical protein
MECTIKKIEDGLYEYRGCIIERNDYLKDGYLGRWSVWNNQIQRITLEECKTAINAKLNKT